MTDRWTREPSSAELAIERRQTQAAKIRRNRIIAGGIIAATLPFYCAGLLLWAFAPNDVGGGGVVPPASTLPGIVTRDTSGGGNDEPTLRPTQTLRPTITSLPGLPTTAPGLDLGFPTTVATAFRPPTSTTSPSQTPLPTNTPIPTNTVVPPTNTLVPTETPTATEPVRVRPSDTPIPFLDS